MIWPGMTPPPGISVRITGQPVLMTTVMDALTSGRVEMSLLGLVLIFVLLLIIYRDLIKALLPVLPMLVVIGWMGGVMYLWRTEVHSPHGHTGRSGPGSRLGVCHTDDGTLL